MDCEALLLSPVDAVCIFLDYISLTLFPQSCWHTLCPSNFTVSVPELLHIGSFSGNFTLRYLFTYF